MSTMGFAARPGTDVEPTWSIRATSVRAGGPPRCGPPPPRTASPRGGRGRPGRRSGCAHRWLPASPANRADVRGSPRHRRGTAGPGPGRPSPPGATGRPSIHVSSASLMLPMSPGTGRWRASTSPSGLRPATTSPSPTRSTPWWWCDEQASGPDLVVAESRVPATGSTSCIVCGVLDGHAVFEQAGRAGQVLAQGAAERHVHDLHARGRCTGSGRWSRSAARSSAISKASRSGSTP